MGFSLTPTKEVKPMATVSITHGVPGIGKTSLWAYAPDPLFLMVKDEVGLKKLIAEGRLPAVQHFPEPAKTLDDVNEALNLVANGTLKCKTLVIDTVNSVEQLIHRRACEELFNNDMASFMSFHAGYDASLYYIEAFIELLGRVRSRGVAISLIAHTKIETLKNPMGPDYDRYVPQMHKKTWGLINNFSDLVLFANYELQQGEKAGKGKVKVAAVAQQAFIHPIRTAAYDAKNRHGLTGKISMGKTGQEAWANLERALKSCKSTGKQEPDQQPETEPTPEEKEAA